MVVNMMTKLYSKGALGVNWRWRVLKVIPVCIVYPVYPVGFVLIVLIAFPTIWIIARHSAHHRYATSCRSTFYSDEKKESFFPDEKKRLILYIVLIIDMQLIAVQPFNPMRKRYHFFWWEKKAYSLHSAHHRYATNCQPFIMMRKGNLFSDEKKCSS